MLLPMEVEPPIVQGRETWRATVLDFKGAALPTGSTGSGIEGRIPPMDLWTTRRSVSCLRWTWQSPRGAAGFEHGVENEQQLAHHGYQRHFGWFTSRAQAQVKRLEHWIAPHRGNRGHIQRPTYARPAARNLALATQGSAITVEWRHAGQRRG
jgi:hypothetical protein